MKKQFIYLWLILVSAWAFNATAITKIKEGTYTWKGETVGFFTAGGKTASGGQTTIDAGTQYGDWEFIALGASGRYPENNSNYMNETVMREFGFLPLGYNDANTSSDRRIEMWYRKNIGVNSQIKLVSGVYWSLFVIKNANGSHVNVNQSIAVRSWYDYNYCNENPTDDCTTRVYRDQTDNSSEFRILDLAADADTLTLIAYFYDSPLSTEVPRNGKRAFATWDTDGFAMGFYKPGKSISSHFEGYAELDGNEYRKFTQYAAIRIAVTKN